VKDLKGTESFQYIESAVVREEEKFVCMCFKGKKDGRLFVFVVISCFLYGYTHTRGI
jgi:hypothetical protein